MGKHPLHISNSALFTNRFKEFNIEGDILTWQEMLCEGPTVEQVYSEEFSSLRKAFLNSFYGMELNMPEIKMELEKLNHLEEYSEIILWFQYDLFCHINLIAIINLIQQKKIACPSI